MQDDLIDESKTYAPRGQAAWALELDQAQFKVNEPAWNDGSVTLDLGKVGRIRYSRQEIRALAHYLLFLTERTDI